MLMLSNHHHLANYLHSGPEHVRPPPPVDPSTESTQYQLALPVVKTGATHGKAQLSQHNHRLDVNSPTKPTCYGEIIDPVASHACVLVTKCP